MNANAPTLSLVEAEEFAVMWCRLTGATHLTLTAITPDGPTTTATFRRGQASALQVFIADHQRAGRNIYFQPNETPPDCASKAGKSAMVAALCRHADIDPDDERFPLADERERLRRLAAALAADTALPPSVIIDSGNGIQPLWVVAREALSPDTLARVEAENRAVEAALGAVGTHDVSRLLRLPGTVNFPNKTKAGRGRGASRARVLSACDAVYSAGAVAGLGEHLSALLYGAELLHAKAAPQPELAAADDDPIMDRVFAAIGRNGKLGSRWAGDTSGLRDSSRSSIAFALCSLLKREGFDKAETFHALHRHNVVGAWCRDKGGAGGARELERIWEKAGAEEPARASPWPPLQRDLATAEPLPPPPLPLDIFPGDWPRWITDAAQRAGAPPDYVACSLLAVVGAALGNARWASPWDGWKHPPVINMACIGLPSAGKSPAINAVADPFAELAADLNEDYEDRRRAYRTAKQEAKERRALWEAEVREAVKHGTPPPIEPLGAREPEQPWKRRTHSGDPTMEAARDLSGVNPRGLLLHRDELAGWIAGMDRYGNGSAGAARAFWLQAYEGSRWTSDRVKDGDDARDVPHLTWGILGGIQPDRLGSLLLNGDDDGLSG